MVLVQRTRTDPVQRTLIAALLKHFLHDVCSVIYASTGYNKSNVKICLSYEYSRLIVCLLFQFK